MRSQRCTLLAGAAACLALLATAPAQAGEVLVVGGSGTERVEDPFVPSGASAEILRPGVPAGPGVATRSAAAGAAATPRRSAPRARSAGAGSRRARRATSRALRRALRRDAIPRKRFRAYRRIVMRARRTQRRLDGARADELGNAIALVDGMALRGQLKPTRMPALLLTLRRNAQYWPDQPFPSDRDHIMFRGSRVIFEYYAGNGLQLQPLVNFKQANLMHGACVKKGDDPCDRRGLRKLLRELLRTAARRGGFKTWEYYFAFGGGSPPWISGMAQATAIQALGRASDLLGIDRYRGHARAALGAFRKPPPTGVRTTGPLGGPHYLQYSFAPRLYIINAFLQSLIGLYDYAKITDHAGALRLFRAAEPEARRELAANDIGDWSTYSYRGAESTFEYHELLREFASSMCSRLRTRAYCETARSFESYMTDPAEVELLGPRRATKGRTVQLRFFVSKRSAVQVTVTRDGKTVLDRLGTFSRGNGSFAWTPAAPGRHRVRVAAKELRTGRGLRSDTVERIDVERR